MLTIHRVQAQRQGETIFQHLCRNKRTYIEAIHTCHLDDTLTLHEVTTDHIVGTSVSTADTNIMVMADTCAKHFVLPVNISATILQSDTCPLGIFTQLTGSSHIISIKNLIECYISIISNVCLFLSTLLCCDNDYTISCFRTIDSRSSSITKHIDALDIVWRNDRDIYTRDSINYIVRRHSTRAKCRSTTQCD